MAESTIQLAAAQTGDRVRTARKNIDSLDVHSQYVIPDVPWTIWGAYSWCGRFVGTTGSGDSGVLAALLRPTGATKDIVILSVSIGYNNEGASNANYVNMVRTTALPGANSAVSASAKSPRNSLDTSSSVLAATPAASADAFIKPTGITLGSEPVEAIASKPATGGASATKVADLTGDGEPFVLTSGQALALYQVFAGTVTETWQIAFDWMEVTL